MLNMQVICTTRVEGGLMQQNETIEPTRVVVLVGLHCYARKSVFGVSDQVLHKPSSMAT